jgi:hypothetical protein
LANEVEDAGHDPSSEVKALDQAIQTGHLGERWSNVTQQINSEHRRALEIYASLLDVKAPEQIPEEELKELKNSLLEVRKEVEESDIPTWVVRYVNRQIDSILKAIREYRVIGHKAFTTALREIVQEESRHRASDHVPEELEEQEREQARSILEKLREAEQQLAVWLETAQIDKDTLREIRGWLQLIGSFSGDGWPGLSGITDEHLQLPPSS